MSCLNNKYVFCSFRTPCPAVRSITLAVTTSQWRFQNVLSLLHFPHLKAVSFKSRYQIDSRDSRFINQLLGRCEFSFVGAFNSLLLWKFVSKLLVPTTHFSYFASFRWRMKLYFHSFSGVIWSHNSFYPQLELLYYHKLQHCVVLGNVEQFLTSICFLINKTRKLCLWSVYVR
jgi:hypothetical protein